MSYALLLITTHFPVSSPVKLTPHSGTNQSLMKEYLRVFDAIYLGRADP
jgi:hypothetical protein